MQVREVIELLTKILEENGTSRVEAETFRAAKFNKDSAVVPLWKLLFQLLYLTKYGVLDEKVEELSENTPIERLVGQVKRELQARGYMSQHLASLPDSGASGSRELLLALAWLLASAAVIDRFIDQRPSLLDQDYRAWTLSQQGSTPEASPAVASSSSEPAEVQAQRLLLLTGKLRLNLRQLYALQQQEARLICKVHESTRGVSLVPNQPHLAVLEVQLLRHPAMMKKMLKLLEEDNTRLQHLLLFKEQEKVFWKWMDSILDLRNQELAEARQGEGDSEGSGPPPPVYLPVSASCPQRIHEARQQLLEAILKYESTISHLEELWLHKKSAVSKYDLDKLLASIMAEISHHQAKLKLLGQEAPPSPRHSAPRLTLQAGKPRDLHRHHARAVAGGRPGDQGVASGQGTEARQADLGQLVAELEEEVRQLELELRQKQIHGRDVMLDLAKAIPNVVCIEPMALRSLSAQLP